MSDDAAMKRLEEKVDRLTEAINKLVLIEERQSNHSERLGKVENSIAAHSASIHLVDAKLDKWINRGIGVWAFAGVVFILVQFGMTVAIR
jgi:low affinity Fe/Cu permease